MIDCSKTENYFNEKLKMTKRTKNGLCEIKCSNCPLCSNKNGEGLPCPEFEMYYPEKAIAIVQKWSDEHPRRTYLTEFLKHYPNAQLKDDGTPEICLSSLGLTNYNGCRNGITCSECWNQPVSIEEDKE
ncbi:hypothetical protein DXD83_10780 [Ruminococcus bromii]|jgi:hypothetical protein|nr:hypothetical protein [Ruminococcus bromii]RGI76137.1 hypothetical protein DXD86_10780 [Ruminococcus bromii]RGI80485.1 hypothetical protein DXD83_10780 [Ruminococcus bromii]